MTEPSEFVVRSEDDEVEMFDALVKDIDQISAGVDALQRENWTSRASLSKLLKRLVYARLLYSLSGVPFFSERRRNRFKKSAEKRDPLLLSRKVDEFCVRYYKRIGENKMLAKALERESDKRGVRVTAIVPNFNHAEFLRQRLDCILNQTYPLIDVLILDDCSTDGSASIIDDYVERYPDRVRVLYNSKNSGNVFLQWKKGVSNATGEIVWICESDDFCELTFVERAIRAFRDSSVMLAFGRIQYANSDGEYVEGLDQYRESAEVGIWENQVVRPAGEWFNSGFGVKNLIPNVGGSLWRRFDVPEHAWNLASEFKVMGDWYLYSIIAGDGKIAYEPSAVSYFRIHGKNTSGKNAQSKKWYYTEYFNVMRELKSQWDISADTIDRFLVSCETIYRHSNIRGAKFAELIDASKLKAIKQTKIHVLMGISGFSFGGGEIFPIHLANSLHKLGVGVSILKMHSADDHDDVRRMLTSAIPVYTADHVREVGVAAFLKSVGACVIHSHISNVDALFLDNAGVDCCYISTLHGSYEAMNIPKAKVRAWSKKIDRFVYLADRNLRPFENIDLPPGKFVKMPNAMPVDYTEFPKTRAELGISQDAIIFTLVARGVDGKGWAEAVESYMQLRARRPDLNMALLMAGDGPAADTAKKLAASDSSIHFFGFVKEIHGLYRISDVALMPTRYPGESFPLTVVQALQVGVPCIATDVGEIRMMSQVNSAQAGLILPGLEDDDKFVSSLTDAMETMLDDTCRNRFREIAARFVDVYDIDALAVRYLAEYQSLIRGRQS